MALMKTSNPALNVNSFRVEQAVSGEAMTLTGTVNKTGRRCNSHRGAGQRSSIAFIISSAHRTASAIALTVAGTFFPPSN